MHIQYIRIIIKFGEQQGVDEERERNRLVKEIKHQLNKLISNNR